MHRKWRQSRRLTDRVVRNIADMRSINPATGALVAEYAEYSGEEVVVAVDRAHSRFLEWRRVSFADRARPMGRLGEILVARQDELAHLMAVEMGKPIGSGRGEVVKSAWVCRYYAAEAEEMLADRLIETERSKSYVHHEPMGAVLAVMPWNFPLWQVIRFSVPALMAGNTAVLKHASNVTGFAIAIEDMYREAGFPDGCFTTLVVPRSRVGEIVEHPHIVAVTLTGSAPAGRAVAAKAGSLLKKTVLELGGSDPSIVLADADVELAAASCVAGRLVNSGQSCIAAKRFIVHEDIYDDWLERFTDKMAATVMGDPLDESTQLGPQARLDLRDELHDQVLRSIAAGATLHLGGTIPEGDGAFYPPTILTDVGPDVPAYSEELFGPVATVIKVASDEEAVRIANDTEFGLGAAIYTQDLARGEKLAATFVDAGSVFVNDVVASDPWLPFGGIKASGFGRELSDLGIKEFVNAKTVVVA
jgi:succinate-semialdehyde dehydrogenase/glutarate-semialdehyde dehydrogenase